MEEGIKMEEMGCMAGVEEENLSLEKAKDKGTQRLELSPEEGKKLLEIVCNAGWENALKKDTDGSIAKIRPLLTKTTK
jgi:hypothetical protein